MVCGAAQPMRSIFGAAEVFPAPQVWRHRGSLAPTVASPARAPRPLTGGAHEDLTRQWVMDAPDLHLSP